MGAVISVETVRHVGSHALEDSFETTAGRRWDVSGAARSCGLEDFFFLRVTALLLVQYANSAE